MKQNINIEQFRDQFKSMNRDHYTYSGYEIIFSDLEEMFEGDYELDVIAICCDYEEYNEDELKNDYGVDNCFSNMNQELEDRVVGWTDDTVILRAA